MFLFVRWYQCVSFSVRIHFSTTCLSNSRKNETYTWKAVHWLWCVSGYQGNEGKSQVLLPMPTVAIQSCRLHTDESNILFLPNFLFLSTALVLYSLGIFLSFGIRIKSVADAKKSRVYLFVLRWKFTKLLRKVKFHSYLLCWWNLFHSFFSGFVCFFYQTLLFIVPVMFLSGIHFLIHKRASAESYWNSGNATHGKYPNRERERACALDDGWLVGRWMCC